jgi:hypothetical protein
MLLERKNGAPIRNVDLRGKFVDGRWSFPIDESHYNNPFFMALARAP